VLTITPPPMSVVNPKMKYYGPGSGLNTAIPHVFLVVDSTVE